MPVTDDRILTTRYGFIRVPDAARDIIGRHLVQFGEWAWLETKFLSTVIPDGARILDAGAFVGTFGLGVAAARPLGFLCAVDANPLLGPLLRQNVAGNVDCPYAVVEAVITGPDRRSGPGQMAPGNLGATSFAGDASGAAGRGAVTLADLRVENGPFDLIKLDIEGMERDALLGDADALRAGGTALWLECNEDPRSLDLLRLLLSWQLDVFYFAFPSFNPGNLKGRTAPIYPWAFEAGLLAAPRTTPALTPDLAAAGCMLRPVHSVEELKDLLWQTPRWGMPDWHGAASLPCLAALVGRSLTDQRRDTFLAVDEAAPPQTVWTRLQRADAALDEAGRLLDAERQQRTQVDDAFHAAEDLARAHLADAQAERSRRERAEAGLRDAEALALERLDALDAERAWRGRVEQHSFDAVAEAQAAAEQLRAEHGRRCAAEQRLQDAQAAAAENSRREQQLRDRVDQLARELDQVAARCSDDAHQVLLLERALAQATARGLAHLSALGSERERAVEREDELAAQHALAAEAAARRVEAAERRALALERAARSAEQQAGAAEAALRVMQASTMWRMLAPLRGFLHGRPRLRAVLRRAEPGTDAAA